MKGFEITFRRKTINVAPNFGVSIFVYQRNGYFHVDATGLEEKNGGEMLSYKWLDTDMEIGESLEIEIKDIDVTDKPIKTEIAFSDATPLSESEIEGMLQEKLAYYCSLEKLLKSEGLL